MKTHRFTPLIAVVFSLLLGSRLTGQEAGPGVQARIWKLEEMTDAQLAALNREQAMFVLTFGNVEVHGPHLPLGTDHFIAAGFRDGLVERLHASHPERDIVLMPMVPLGEGAVEELAGRWDHTGSFSVRYGTLRNVAIDLGSEAARKGFKYIFLLHAHGGFFHNIAFSEASAFVSQRYSVRMENLASYVFAGAFDSPDVMARHVGPRWLEETGLFHHGGAGETAKILFLRPELVGKTYRDLPPFVARDLAGAFDVSARGDWQGYWGHPAQGSARLGADLMRDLADAGFQLAERVLRGEDLSALPAYPESVLKFPDARAYFEKLREHDARQTAEVDEWLRTRSTGRRPPAPTAAAIPDAGFPDDANIVPDVTAKMQAYLAALRSLDFEGAIGHYLNDPQFRTYFDGHESGYADFVAAVRASLKEVRNLEGNVEGLVVTPLAPDAALASFRFVRTITDSAGKASRHRGTTTWVWVKRGGEWRIVHGHAVHIPIP